MVLGFLSLTVQLKGQNTSKQEYYQIKIYHITQKAQEAPYARIESFLLKAFPDYPEFLSPNYTTASSERIYELRSYESATETYGIKKIDMFNRGGEILIFKKLQFNPVFFAQVISGGRMPGLMYMPTFQNKATQDENG